MAAVKAGSDVLFERGFDELSGLRVGFVGNHTSRLADRAPSHLAMLAAGVDVRALFSPEHGAFGREDHEEVADDIDPASKLQIHSLYRGDRKPARSLLEGLDALVFELQDVGARFYTYASTMLLCLEAAVECGIRFIVLDRPNPISGDRFGGPIADADRLSFTACYTIPVRHALTLGELAILAAAERGLSESLSVIPCAGWRRSMWWDQTGLDWIAPSPAMNSPETAAVYPGVCLLEQTNVSVGRGTDAPFLTAGAPWIEAARLADRIAESCGDSVEISPASFTPTHGKLEGEQCSGVRLRVTDREQFESVRLGISMIASLRDLWPSEFQMDGVDRLLVNDATMKLLIAGAGVDEIVQSWRSELSEWRKRIEPCFIYQS